MKNNVEYDEEYINYNRNETETENLLFNNYKNKNNNFN
jgi:hypothetical protein